MKVSQEYLKQIIKEEVEVMVEEGELEEGLWDRMTGGVSSAWQGLKGGVKSGVAGAIGKAAGAAGLKGIQGAADTAKGNIQAQTAAKQRAVKIKSVVLPKIQNMKKDLEIVFKGEESKPFFKKIFQNIVSLEKMVNDQLVGSGAGKPVTAEFEELE